jgi:hypothetical protein
MRLLLWTLLRLGLVAVIVIVVASLFFGVAANPQVPTSGNVFVGCSFEGAGSSSFDLSYLGVTSADLDDAVDRSAPSGI